ncbi:hypothetical protein PVAND_009467 [Polypedilum vanderplanki]|uniref:Uncharacterized protein n=1 Tax=Polypedilum vanderplanki TaxID=319348 RepID=A0A9J6CDT8_POLVA|nr:hypothetical protein PVAND_009467 [Polypedilum vanderplanki]
MSNLREKQEKLSSQQSQQQEQSATTTNANDDSMKQSIVFQMGRIARKAIDRKARLEMEQKDSSIIYVSKAEFDE